MVNTFEAKVSFSLNDKDKILYKKFGASAMELADKGEFLSARDKLLDVMLEHGLSGLDVIKQIKKEIWNLSIDDNKKIKLIDKCGDIEFRMVEGSDEFLQLEALLANFIEK